MEAKDALHRTLGVIITIKNFNEFSNMAVMLKSNASRLIRTILITIKSLLQLENLHRGIFAESFFNFINKGGIGILSSPPSQLLEKSS